MRFDLAEQDELTHRLRGWLGLRLGIAIGLAIAAVWVYKVDLLAAVIEQRAFKLEIGPQSYVYGFILTGLLWGVLFRLRAGVTWAIGLGLGLGPVAGLVAALDGLFAWGVNWEWGEQLTLITSPDQIRSINVGPTLVLGIGWSLVIGTMSGMSALAASALGATVLRRPLAATGSAVFGRMPRVMPFGGESGARQSVAGRLNSLAAASAAARPASRIMPALGPEHPYVRWSVLARGILAVAYVAVAFILLALAPVLKTDLAFPFGAYVFLDGALLFLVVTRSRALRRSRWIFGLKGIVGLVAGAWAVAATLSDPSLGAVSTYYYIAGYWAILSGVLGVIAGAWLIGEVSGELLTVVVVGLGVTRIAYGYFTVMTPDVWNYASVQGLMLIAYAIMFGGLHFEFWRILSRWPGTVDRPVTG